MFKVEPHVYFDSHYRFDVPACKVQKKIIGDSSIDILLINVIIPLLFTYAKQIGNENLQSRSIGFLQVIKPEKNTITKKWRELEMPMSSAYDSQALIQLKNEDCRNKKCLTCAIGMAILKPANHD